MEQNILSQLIDSRNRNLWDDISAKYTVQLTASTNNEYSCYTQNQTAIIYVPKRLCVDSFTHELLHIYLRMKDIYITSALIRLIASNERVKKISSSELIEHIGNCLCHIKMLPVYIGLGFDKQHFLEDFYTHKCSDAELASIKNNFKTLWMYNSKAIDLFIGKFIAMKADPNSSNDYSSYLNELMKIDKELYVVLDNLYNDWLTIDIEKEDIMHNYCDVAMKFYQELNAWATDKTLI
jgi:hypothetical protein